MSDVVNSGVVKTPDAILKETADYQINIPFMKSFVEKFVELKKKYGENLATLNGLSDKQLGYTPFIDNFIDKNTTADASIDGSANVSNKDIVTLESEMRKPHSKLIGFNKIYYEMAKQFGLNDADAWLVGEWLGDYYLHDAHNATFKSYCYKGEEMLTVKYNGKVYNTTFADLYDLVDEKESYDESIKQDAKFPRDLYILDLEDKKEVFTKVTRLVKHTNKRKMRFIKYANGLSQIVTDDHPIITKDGEVPAKNVTKDHKVYTIAPTYFTNTIKEIEVADRRFKMSRKFGWLVGLCLTEGTAIPSNIYVSQTYKSPVWQKLVDLLDEFDIPYKLKFVHPDDESPRIVNLLASPFQKFLSKIMLGHTSEDYHLPPEYIHYSYKFLDGFVAGVIDGDGTLDGYKSRHCQIRIASQPLVNQITNYLRFQGIFCSARTPHRYYSEKSYAQNLLLYGACFTLTDEDYFSSIGSYKIETKYIPKIRKKGDFKTKGYEYKYGWVSILDNSEFIDKCNIVYDITTETGHFLCNNILSHNCFAYSLKQLVEKGLYWIKTFNNQPPKHLCTFTDFVGEFISYNCNRTSGAKH